MEILNVYWCIKWCINYTSKMDHLGTADPWWNSRMISYNLPPSKLGGLIIWSTTFSTGSPVGCTHIPWLGPRMQNPISKKQCYFMIYWLICIHIYIYMLIVNLSVDDMCIDINIDYNHYVIIYNYNYMSGCSVLLSVSVAKFKQRSCLRAERSQTYCCKRAKAMP